MIYDQIYSYYIEIKYTSFLLLTDLLCMYCMYVCMYVCMYALQKQIGCFNLRVITMVADKLKRHWLLEGMED